MARVSTYRDVKGSRLSNDEGDENFRARLVGTFSDPPLAAVSQMFDVINLESHATLPDGQYHFDGAVWLGPVIDLT